MIDKKKTIFISFSTLLQILFGFLLQITIANKMGFSKDLDLYFVTISIGFIFIVVFNTAISYGVTALFTNIVKKKNSKRLNLISNSLINYMVLLFIGIFFILNIFIEDLVSILSSNYENNIQNAIIKEIFLYYSVGIIFSVISLIGIALNYSHNKFYLSSSSFAIDFFIQFLVMIFFIDNYGIVTLAIAFLVGQIVKSILLMIPFVKYYRFYFNFRIIKNMILINIMPLTFSAFYSNTNLLLDRYFASKFNIGDVSILQYSLFISASVASVLGKGLSILSLNSLATLSIEEQHQILMKNIKMATYFFILYFILYLIIGKYLLEFIFTFTDKINSDSIDTIFILVLILSFQIYAGLVASILNNMYYNNNEVRLISIISIISQTINIVLKVFLFSNFGIIGLVWGTVVHHLISLFMLGYFYKIKFLKKVNYANM